MIKYILKDLQSEIDKLTNDFAQKEISEYYRVETSEGCLASYCVPFNSVHYEKGGILFVDDPKFEKRANKKIARLVLGGK